MDVALVGLQLPGVENHSLRALVQAAAAAGFSSGVVPFRGWPEMGAAIRAIERAQPRVCGVSIQTSEAALASLALVRLLRGRRFGGQVVVGGHFATLNAQEILESPAGVDTVVRFAGEEALVGLLRGAPLSSLPGLVFRDERGVPRLGAPARVRGAGLVSAPSRDGELPEHLGFPAADLIASRGCEARCAYCCVDGASTLAAKEAARAGEVAHGPLASRRALSGIADEIAALFHDRGARVFTFMDDNVLPLDPADAGRWARQMRSLLDRRRVGRIALSLQLRADAVTEEAAQALVDLGVVRAYVGIDGYTQPMLRQLGRRAAVQAGPAALARLAGRGVFSVCNALILGPTFSFATVCGELDGLARVEHAPVHLLPIDVRAGTRYSQVAERRGLIEGGFLFRYTRCEDPRTALVARALTGLPTRLAERSVPIALYDLGYNLGIARRLVPGARVERAVALYARVTRQWNADQIRVLRRAVAAAADGEVEAIEALLREERPRVRAHDDALLAECDGALAEVERAVSAARRRPVSAHARGRLLSSVALAMGLAACTRDRPLPTGDAAVGAVDMSARDAGADLAQPRDLVVPTDFTGVSCSHGEPPADWDTRSLPFDICEADCNATIELTFDSKGSLSRVGPQDLPPAVLQCLQAFFGAHCYPSLANQTTRFEPHCWIA